MNEKLCHSTQFFLWLTGDYLGTEGLLSRAMVTRPCRIDCFERNYDKAFTGHRLFGADIMDRIHK